MTNCLCRVFEVREAAKASGSTDGPSSPLMRESSDSGSPSRYRR